MGVGNFVCSNLFFTRSDSSSVSNIPSSVIGIASHGIPNGMSEYMHSSAVPA
jgi:hypothetical protein